jgi:hypothetical protein
MIPYDPLRLQIILFSMDRTGSRFGAQTVNFTSRLCAVGAVSFALHSHGGNQRK